MAPECLGTQRRYGARLELHDSHWGDDAAVVIHGSDCANTGGWIKRLPPDGSEETLITASEVDDQGHIRAFQGVGILVKQRWESVETQAMSGPHECDEDGMVGFRLRIFPGKRAQGEPVRDCSGAAAAWEDYTTVRVEAFDSGTTLDLHPLWRRVHAERLARLVETVIGLETIVKFGNTMQLEHAFTVLIEAEFSGEPASR